MINLKKININQNIKTVFAIIISAFFSLILLRFPMLCSQGVIRGIELSAQTVVPSLFPFLVLSSFVQSSGALDFLGKKTDLFFNKIFRLSGKAGCTVFFSLFAGFPVGCSMAAELYSKNKICRNEAKRIALSSVNAGPAFVIGAVGTSLLSSAKAGVIIFVSLSLSSLMIAFFSRYILNSDSSPQFSENKALPLSKALVCSVYNGSKSMFIICGWIILFSCFLNIISSNTKSEASAIFLKAFLEVTSGCCALAEKESPVIICAVLGWCGMCIHCQVFPYILKIGLKAKYYFCSRVLHSMLSSIICYGLFQIFPCEVSVFSTGTEAMMKTFAVSAPAAAGLALMCVIFILDLDTAKEM